jgi:hypothetical protein
MARRKLVEAPAVAPPSRGPVPRRPRGKAPCGCVAGAVDEPDLHLLSCPESPHAKRRAAKRDAQRLEAVAQGMAQAMDPALEPGTKIEVEVVAPGGAVGRRQPVSAPRGRVRAAKGGRWTVEHVERSTARVLARVEVGPEGPIGLGAVVPGAVVWVDPQPGATAAGVEEAVEACKGRAAALRASTAPSVAQVAASVPTGGKASQGASQSHREVVMQLAETVAVADRAALRSVLDEAMTGVGL